MAKPPRPASARTGKAGPPKRRRRRRRPQRRFFRLQPMHLFAVMLLGLFLHHMTFNGRLGNLHAYAFSTQITRIYADTQFGLVPQTGLRPFTVSAGVAESQAVGKAAAVDLIRASGTSERISPPWVLREQDTANRVSLRFVLPGDRLCPLEAPCIEITRPGSVGLMQDGLRVYWSFRHAFWNSGDMDFGRVSSLLADGSGPVGIMADDHWQRAVRIDFLQGRASADLSLLASAAHWTLPYKVMAFSLLFVLGLTLWKLLRSIYAQAGNAQRLVLALLPVPVLISITVLLWPGIYVHDFIFQASTAPDQFTSFYSSAYQIYNYMLSTLGYWWHGLIPLLLWLTAALCVAECALAFRQRVPAAVRTLSLAALFLALPALVLTLTGVQRHFTAPSFIFTALALQLTLFLPTLRRRDWLHRALLSILFLSFGIAMRADYVLLVPASLYALWANRRTGFHRIDSGRLALRGLAISTAVFVGLHFAPTLHGYGPKGMSHERLYLGLVSLVDMVRPYAACSRGRQTELEARIRELGPFEAYCRMAPELFFWNEAAPRIARNEEPYFKTKEALQGILWSRALSNPFPFIGNRIIRTRNIFFRRYWHLHTAIPVTAQELTDVHRSRAARYGLVQGPGPKRDAARAFTKMLRALSGMSFLLLLFVAGLVIFLLNRRLWFSTLTTGAFLGAAAVAVLLSPTGNWAYAVYIPLWAAFVLWFAAAELAARRQKRRMERMKSLM